MLDFLSKADIKVPQDLSVIGIDNSLIAEHTTPPLTSINHPKELLGKAVAENLLKKLADPAFDATLEFEPKIVERASVKKIL